jgi:hypothetical protein
VDGDRIVFCEIEADRRIELTTGLLTSSEPSLVEPPCDDVNGMGVARALPSVPLDNWV